MRFRNCTNPPPINNGSDCQGPRNETQQCNVQPCPVDGNFTNWGPWGPCSASCAGGTQIRFRNCTNPPPINNGSDCQGPRNETQQCNVQPCPVDGNFTNWGPWGHCSASCAGGTQIRFRNCTNPPPINNGSDCQGPRNETQQCNVQPCPVDGNFTNWGPWGPCSASCAPGGIQIRFRNCTNPPPINNGLDCQGPRNETQQCNVQPCPVDGNFTNWGPWGHCSASCAGGTQMRLRNCTNPPPINNGSDCQGPHNETQQCNVQPCPVDGNFTGWGPWGPCSASCAGGTQIRFRNCTNPPPINNGSDCQGPRNETQQCNAGPCPVSKTLLNRSRQGYENKLNDQLLGWCLYTLPNYQN
ncbi:coadhesin-like [Oculina patagonica]